MADLVERYADQILGVLSCYDRVIVRGRLADIDYAKGMAVYLRAHGVRLFDFPQWAKPFRDEIRDNTERLAQEHGIEVRFVRGNERKETIVAEILEQRGESPGLVAILSALEPCESFEPRYDKKIARPREASPRKANRAAHSCARTAPSARTTTSTSSMRSSACAASGFPRGARSACRRTSTVTACWRASCAGPALLTRCTRTR